MENIKYPKTMHFPWSEGLQNDDRRIETIENFIGKEIIVTDKLDGENTAMTRIRCHARSLDSKHHPSRNIVKQIHASIAHNIPEGWKLFGENVYAKHSIFYDKLSSYFYLFNIWTDKFECLSWNDTLEWAEILGLETVPVLYRGIWDEERVKACWTGKSAFGDQEGYVVRIASNFNLEEFPICVGKFVSKEFRENMSDIHWASSKVIPNLLNLRSK